MTPAPTHPRTDVVRGLDATADELQTIASRLQSHASFLAHEIKAEQQRMASEPARSLTEAFHLLFDVKDASMAEPGRGA